MNLTKYVTNLPNLIIAAAITASLFYAVV